MVSFRAMAAVSIALWVADPPPSLRVIRTTPDAEAAPTTVISVTFDRPVVGSLDRAVDPATVLSIVPAVPGTLEWRDPVTLRLKPAAPLSAGVSYAVTVNPSFSSLDGARLSEPYHFGFRVAGPRVLAGLPVAEDQSPRFVTPNETFRLALSSSADLAALVRLAYIEPGATCPRRGVIRLTALDQRTIADSAPWQLREAPPAAPSAPPSPPVLGRFPPTRCHPPAPYPAFKPSLRPPTARLSATATPAYSPN